MPWIGPTSCHCLLQARVDALTGAAPAAAKAAATDCGEAAEDSEGREQQQSWEWDETLEVEVTAAGTWNAVAFWFDAELSPAAPGAGSGSGSSQQEDSSSGSTSGGVDPPSRILVVSNYAQGRAGVAAARSWDQAVQYVDASQVAKASLALLSPSLACLPALSP